MEQINIFDVSKITSPSSTSGAAEDGWSSQVITGTVPEPRVDFCLVLASAPDNSSLNIYMYGGMFTRFCFLLCINSYSRLGSDAD
jgi:hypothetical protein